MTAITRSVSLERRGAVAVLTVDNPPVNALSQHVRQGLRDGLRQAIADPGVVAVVIACAGRTFIAGADITEFGKPPQEPVLWEVLDLMESSPKPVVAAIHGTALGGGLETTMACHWRIGVRSARLGQPEVKLGIIPGAGGTQRLPRLVGVETALQMIVGGDPIGADEAHRLGLLDELADGDLTTAAVAFAERVVAEGRPLRRVRDMNDKVAAARGKPQLFSEFRKSVARQTRGLKAPEACIQALEAAVTLPFEAGIARERELFIECLTSPESKAQRYFFFAEREAAKIPDVPADTPVKEIRKAAVIGAGTMGGGIAMNFANAGIPVTVVEVSQEALDRGLGIVRKNYEATAAKGRLTRADVEQRMGLLRGTTDFGAVADADIIIEAVFEEMPIKKEVFAKLDAIAKPGAVLATNTSTLDVNEIATATKRPASVIGTHFFSPANVMRLLENVRGAKTDKPTIATAMAAGRRIGKVPVLVGVCYGFVGNRMLHQRGQQAEQLILEGAPPHQVDKVLTDFGFPMGPFAMSDLAGLDVGWRIRKGRGVTSAVADRICELGRFGQKTGAGYYRYEKGDRTPMPDPEVERIITEVAKAQGIQRRSIAETEILERLLYPMVNEGAKILEEGIAIRASDIDVIWVYGYGWPVYRGGPMFWADQVGLPAIHDRLREYGRRTGDPFWTPAPLLVRLGEAGKGFLDR
ncbi:MAG TPA: 3-hydroxyacyl-CoA dehydrogenase NAD-binding domain-containing protein [Methylomirabilota bacterium]|jgi:3-hydroxyacyl-CoA dehydrogenase|nr:3-hydroxyacyl-CoA dehydrogenase NAD-binding domain-containing protein [Methylomirabilota bacterium]HEV8673283.1 3-hydroxyacyl-CoA dehydrogenase NAD-binding domain-containing protein [Methylomirabilota bacterium]